MSAEAIRVSPRWLALREAADADARARDLVGALERALPADGLKVIHDLGCGSGSMGRWLAPLLAGPQRWVLHDRDAELLEAAVAAAPGAAADGAPVAVEPRRGDLARIEARDLDGASLITASALLDLLTTAELDRLVEVGAAVGCPVLLTLSVVGEIAITPADPLDREVAAAFDAHQRRQTERGRLLGPRAADHAAAAFRARGARIIVRPSPWRLGPRQSDLIAEWFTGWVDAAREQAPELAARCEPYSRRRLEQASTGDLTVTVGHTDLLVLGADRRGRRRHRSRPRSSSKREESA